MHLSSIRTGRTRNGRDKILWSFCHSHSWDWLGIHGFLRWWPLDLFPAFFKKYEDPGKYTNLNLKMPEPKTFKFRDFYPNLITQFLSTSIVETLAALANTIQQPQKVVIFKFPKSETRQISLSLLVFLISLRHLSRLDCSKLISFVPK